MVRPGPTHRGGATALRSDRPAASALAWRRGRRCGQMTSYSRHGACERQRRPEARHKPRSARPPDQSRTQRPSRAPLCLSRGYRVVAGDLLWPAPTCTFRKPSLPGWPLSLRPSANAVATPPRPWRLARCWRSGHARSPTACAPSVWPNIPGSPPFTACSTAMSGQAWRWAGPCCGCWFLSLNRGCPSSSSASTILWNAAVVSASSPPAISTTRSAPPPNRKSPVGACVGSARCCWSTCRSPVVSGDCRC